MAAWSKEKRNSCMVLVGKPEKKKEITRKT
jgi:hypothetical protein